MAKKAVVKAHQKFQRGAVLIVIFFIVVVAAGMLLSSGFSAQKIKQKTDDHDLQVLNKAKAALILDALTYTVSGDQRPGRFRCPNTHTVSDISGFPDGQSDGVPCSRLGRFPWRTLATEEYTDSAGEHLWYVISRNFTTTHGGAINSNLEPELTLDGKRNIVALIIAPGNAASEEQSERYSDPFNSNFYLESKVQGSKTKFVSMLERGEPINDRIVAITLDDIIPVLERRALKNIAEAMNEFYVKHGSYPWLARPSGPFIPEQYRRTGRIPYTLPGNPESADKLAYKDDWIEAMGWTNLILAVVAEGYTPEGGNSCSAGCLTLLGGDVPVTEKPYVLLAPGPALSGQTRSGNEIQNIAEYFEGENANFVNDIFEIKRVGMTFNDSAYEDAPH